MRRREPRRPEPRHRTKPQRHHRHQAHVGRGLVIELRPAHAARQVGAARRLDRLDRAAAARALDQPDDRQAEFRRHPFGHDRLLADGRIRAAAAHGEVVADHHHRSAIHHRAAHHAVGRREGLQVALRVVFSAPGDRADLVEAALVRQRLDALAHGQAAAIMLAPHLVRPAHLPGQGLAPPQFVEFGLPGHACGVSFCSAECPATAAWRQAGVRARPARREGTRA